MARGKKDILLEQIEMIDIHETGKSVGKKDGLVVFVEGALPGDVVDVQVFRRKSSFYEGKAVAFHQYSPLRTEPFCEHFGMCGGCKWQHLKYEEQLRLKEKHVLDALARIGKIDVSGASPIMGCQQTQGHRNRLDFAFTDRRWLSTEEMASGELLDRHGLGFHLPGRFEHVLDVQTCYLQPEPSNLIRRALRDFAIAQGLSFYSIKERHGFLRSLIMRNTAAGQWMVIVQFGHDHPEHIRLVMDFLKDLLPANGLPAIHSLNYVINTKGNDTFFDLDVQCYAGQPWITETIEDLQFRVRPKSFFQTNSGQVAALYRVAKEMAGLNGQQVVYDLYTGTGTIALYVAGQAKQVIGLEYVEQAVEDARDNARLNSISNATFYAGDIKDMLSEQFLQSHPLPEVVITDPPRAGMHADVVRQLLNIGPARIVYVSCNPATQARDVEMLKERYMVKAIQPVDMFPHTYHVENVMLLERM